MWLYAHNYVTILCGKFHPSDDPIRCRLALRGGAARRRALPAGKAMHIELIPHGYMPHIAMLFLFVVNFTSVMILFDVPSAFARRRPPTWRGGTVGMRNRLL